MLRRIAVLLLSGLITLQVLPARATTLTLTLPGDAPVTQHVARFACDTGGVRLGLPGGPFTVTYWNAGQTAVAILPVGGEVFAQVVSADGGRYAAGRLIWWDTGARGATLSDGTVTAHCHQVRRGVSFRRTG